MRKEGLDWQAEKINRRNLSKNKIEQEKIKEKEKKGIATQPHSQTWYKKKRKDISRELDGGHTLTKKRQRVKILFFKKKKKTKKKKKKKI